MKFKDAINFEAADLSVGASFREVEFGGELIFSSTDLGDCDFYNCQLPERILFMETRPKSLIDLSFVRKNPNGRTIIGLYNVPIDSFKFDYSQFRLAQRITDNGKKIKTENGLETRVDTLPFTEEAIERTYFDIMQMQKKYNYIKGYELARIDHKAWKLRNGFFYEKYIFYPILWNWDNFGYNKDLIFTNTAILFGIFSLISFLFFNFLVKNVYCPKSLIHLKENLRPWKVKNWKNQPYLRIIPYALFYTLIIFFGLRMELDNFSIRANPYSHRYGWLKKLGVFYVLFMYTVGLICTAYLANYIITS